MSRRNLTYAVLVITSFVVAACSQPIAPVREDTIQCYGGVVIGQGAKCPGE